MTWCSKGVCILIDPLLNNVVEFPFSNKSGRITLTTILLSYLKISLCNICTPNYLSEQLEFIQKLKNCLIDKSEFTSLIVCGNWNWLKQR